MKSVERTEETFATAAETQDKEGTYEQKKGGDQGSQTVFTGNQTTAKIILQKPQKTKQSEKVVFSD